MNPIPSTACGHVSNRCRLLENMWLKVFGGATLLSGGTWDKWRTHWASWICRKGYRTAVSCTVQHLDVPTIYLLESFWWLIRFTSSLWSAVIRLFAHPSYMLIRSGDMVIRGSMQTSISAGVESTFSSSLRYFKRFPPPTGLKQHSEKESESVLH